MPADVENPSFVTLDELERVCRDRPSAYIVEGFLPADDVHVAVGDSGLGKTPWAYQLSFCVAEGIPFLGHTVRKGGVLYYDLENGREEVLEAGRRMCAHLGLNLFGFPMFPANFRVLKDEGHLVSLEDAVRQYEPILVVMDTLRAFRPRAEMTNEDMASFLQDCKKVARRHHCAILLLHHIKKPGENGVPSLEDTQVLTWLLQASGARALINQTNTRIAIDTPKNSSCAAHASLVVKFFVKMRGESGPFYLDRVVDTEGEPIGYRRVIGSELLGNLEQEAAFRKLPSHPTEFSFKEAMFAYGKTDNPTSQWLKKCEAAGLIRRIGRGRYQVVDCSLPPAQPINAVETTPWPPPPQA